MARPVNIRNAPFAGSGGFRGTPGALYRPSNGTEGMIFFEGWCDRCARDLAFQRWSAESEGKGRGPRGCPIIAASLIHDKDEPGYPKEWCFDGAGMPQCTAFKPLSALSDAAHKAHATRRRKRDAAHAGRLL